MPILRQVIVFAFFVAAVGQDLFLETRTDSSRRDHAAHDLGAESGDDDFVCCHIHCCDGPPTADGPKLCDKHTLFDGKICDKDAASGETACCAAPPIGGCLC